MTAPSPLTLAAKTLMYAKGGEQLVYLIWELAGERPALAVICTTNDDLVRYVTPDRKSWRRGGAVFVERVMTDHLYGANDMRVARAIIRNSP